MSRLIGAEMRLFTDEDVGADDFEGMVALIPMIPVKGPDGQVLGTMQAISATGEGQTIIIGIAVDMIDLEELRGSA